MHIMSFFWITFLFYIEQMFKAWMTNVTTYNYFTDLCDLYSIKNKNKNIQDWLKKNRLNIEFESVNNNPWPTSFF